MWRWRWRGGPGDQAQDRSSRYIQEGILRKQMLEKNSISLEVYLPRHRGISRISACR